MYMYIVTNIYNNNNKNYNIIRFLYIIYFICNYLVKLYLLKRINFRLTSLKLLFIII